MVIAPVTVPALSLLPATGHIRPLWHIVAPWTRLWHVRHLGIALSPAVARRLALGVNNSGGALFAAGPVPTVVAAQAGSGSATRLGLNGEATVTVLSLSQAEGATFRLVRVEVDRVEVGVVNVRGDVDVVGGVYIIVQLDDCRYIVSDSYGHLNLFLLVAVVAFKDNRLVAKGSECAGAQILASRFARLARFAVGHTCMVLAWTDNIA